MTDLSIFRAYEPSECGLDGYPFAWRGCGGKGVKDLVREEAGHRCVRCLHPYAKGAGEWSPCDEWCVHGGPVRVPAAEGGAVEVVVVEDDEVRAMVLDGTPVEARWRILTVHHLDGDKANCCWQNLVALDQRCHLQIQGKVQMERPWPWPHTGWFRPYAAAYYAVECGANPAPTRGWTMDHLDELLALGAREAGIERMAI